MSVVKAQGIVIRQTNVGEADKIITLFTDKLGKIQVSARGARKSKSKLMSSTQVFAYCEYILFKGRKMYSISQSEIKDSFQVLLNDLYTLTYSSYLVELIDTLTSYDEINSSLFLLAIKTFYLMKEVNTDKELLIHGFEIKSMVLSGYQPNLRCCTECGSGSTNAYRFSSKLGGLICDNCSNMDPSSIKISMSTVNILRYIISNDIDKIRIIKCTDLIKNEMKKILKNYIQYYLEKEFRSLDFLESIKEVENT